jgi:hypothetical protein
MAVKVDHAFPRSSSRMAIRAMSGT